MTSLSSPAGSPLSESLGALTPSQRHALWSKHCEEAIRQGAPVGASANHIDILDGAITRAQHSRELWTRAKKSSLLAHAFSEDFTATELELALGLNDPRLLESWALAGWQQGSLDSDRGRLAARAEWLGDELRKSLESSHRTRISHAASPHAHFKLRSAWRKSLLDARNTSRKAAFPAFAGAALVAISIPLTNAHHFLGMVTLAAGMIGTLSTIPLSSHRFNLWERKASRLLSEVYPWIPKAFRDQLISYGSDIASPPNALARALPTPITKAEETQIAGIAISEGLIPIEEHPFFIRYAAALEARAFDEALPTPALNAAGARSRPRL